MTTIVRRGKNLLGTVREIAEGWIAYRLIGDATEVFDSKSKALRFVARGKR